MREILFRGKRKDTGEWVYGNYLYDGVYKKHYLTKPGEFCGEVIPETLGQYTGVKDKNGKEIFEGDIIKTPKYGAENGKGVNFNGADRFVVRYANGTYVLENIKRSFCLRPDISAEIIGNVHDNPELLETAKKSWR